MSRIIFFVITMVVVVNTYASSNSSYLSFFSPAAVQISNTAKDYPKLSEEEKEAILWTNLARTEPQNFAKMLIVYIQRGNEFQLSNPYVQSLLIDLKKSVSLPPLYTAGLLNKNASSHAEFSQQTKRMGHDNFESRAKIAFKNDYSSYSENCVYGITDALHAVINLLVDENVEDLGHRKIILSNGYNQIGVSVMPFYNANRKVLVQQFGKSSKIEEYTPVETITPPIAYTPKPEAPALPSTVKRMYVNGKYVLVDTSKYYTPKEYQQYLQQAQKLKSAR